MTSIYSPHNIQILLWCHISSEPYSNMDTPAAEQSFKELEACGAIAKTPVANVWATTPLGKAWVQALCNVPPPTLIYVDEMGQPLNP